MHQRAPSKTFKCECGKWHRIQITLQHDAHIKLQQTVVADNRFEHVKDAIHFLVDSYVEDFDMNAAPAITPPQKRIKVKWADLRKASKQDLKDFAKKMGIHTYGKKQELLTRIVHDPRLLVVGKRGGTGGMPL